MNFLCNICSIDLDEKDVKSHIKTQEHEQNKIINSKTIRGSGKSVASMWFDSLD
jgi:hypothetical protein